ncbi:MAG TPA: transcriptional regulator [Alphaproteobacteria bacterium]|jgi:DNA-binding MarR family transcriptional regulator|nr:transcriptional regulator [Alphaproteobacteria bacterium]
MDVLDEIIHQSMRLKIMAALKVLPSDKDIEFVRLRSIIKASEGNLSVHLAVLEKNGYIESKKDFVGKKPRTRINITNKGRRAFDKYVINLQEILDQS